MGKKVIIFLVRSLRGSNKIMLAQSEHFVNDGCQGCSLESYGSPSRGPRSSPFLLLPEGSQGVSLSTQTRAVGVTQFFRAWMIRWDVLCTLSPGSSCAQRWTGKSRTPSHPTLAP